MLIEQIIKEETPFDRKLEGQVATSQALSHEFGLSDAKVAALMQTSKRTAFNHRKALFNVRKWENRTPENKKAAIDRARRLINADAPNADARAWQRAKKYGRQLSKNTGEVNWRDSNRNGVVATGFGDDENEATSAIDDFLEKEGEQYGRSSHGTYDEDADEWYFRVTDYS